MLVPLRLNGTKLTAVGAVKSAGPSVGDHSSTLGVLVNWVGVDQVGADAVPVLAVLQRSIGSTPLGVAIAVSLESSTRSNSNVALSVHIGSASIHAALEPLTAGTAVVAAPQSLVPESKWTTSIWLASK